MHSQQAPTATIGMVKYLNTAPIHEKWKSTVQRDDWQMIEAAPADLNRLLAAERLIWALFPVMNMVHMRKDIECSPGFPSVPMGR